MPSASVPITDAIPTDAATSLASASAMPSEVLEIVQSQWLFTEQDLLLTPSVLAGLSPQQERENRAKGVNFILQVGIMLKLPQITLATASVFLHRFFMRYPMVEDKVYKKPHQHYYSVAATSLFLATKVEENCRKMKELVVACVRVAQKNQTKIVDEQDKEFWRWKDTILQLEDLLLEALCFDLSLDPPYKTLFDFLVYFGEENNRPLRNAAWGFVNDSCLTPLCLLWPSRTIAAAALYAAARSCDVKYWDDKDGRPWWEVIGVPLLHIRKACNFMATVYENAPLRGGTEESSYQRTPEDGDEWMAKTRQTRQPRPSDELEADDRTMVRQGSMASIAESDVSRKRGRGKEGAEVQKACKIEMEASISEIPRNSDTIEERDAKRHKVETNWASGPDTTEHIDRVETVRQEMQTEATARDSEPTTEEGGQGPESPNPGNASEEGEVED